MGKQVSGDSVLAFSGWTEAVPAWVPNAVRWYLAHTEAGQTIRSLARAQGLHASTILRQIRRCEQKRDDPLIDSALTRLGAVFLPSELQKDSQTMTAPMRPMRPPVDDATVNREARRILRRLCETNAYLVISPELEKAAVLKDTGNDQPTRIAVIDRVAAEAFVLNDWIQCDKPGRIATYRITGVGRSALKRLLADEDRRQPGFAEAPMPFAEQHRVWDTREVVDPATEKAQKIRYNLAESPLALLARRKDKGGQPFLSPDLVAAGERLREDFELAQMGPRITQNWDRFLTAGDRGGFGGAGPAEGPRAARDRVAEVLRELGPGLGDVVLRCCCFLEGLEAAEKRMGWSARSGKIVLRIALQRLKQHYDAQAGRGGDLIG